MVVCVQAAKPVSLCDSTNIVGKSFDVSSFDRRGNLGASVVFHDGDDRIFCRLVADAEGGGSGGI